MNAFELRQAIGWGLVQFFLRLTNREWEDLPLEERHACWVASLEEW